MSLSKQSLKWFFFCLFSVQTFAQVLPNGKFLTDSIQIGKPLTFALSYRHEADKDIFFPDTTAQFSPFEIVERSYFSTRTEKGMSIDSVLYKLVSFNTQTIQKLRLPIYIYNKQDCTAVYSATDSVFLHQVVNNINSPIKTVHRFLPLKAQFDFLQFSLLLVALGIICILLYLSFGNAIKRQIRLFRFSQEHKSFLSDYRKILKADIDSHQISDAITLWKKYVGILHHHSFESFTTKELIDRLPDDNLEQVLKELDMAAYGGVLSVNTPAAMRFLQTNAIQVYEEKKKEI